MDFHPGFCPPALSPSLSSLVWRLLLSKKEKRKIQKYKPYFSKKKSFSFLLFAFAVKNGRGGKRVVLDVNVLENKGKKVHKREGKRGEGAGN